MNKKKNFLNMVINILNKIKFNILNLSFTKLITLVGAILGIVSLFNKWIIDGKQNLSWNAFNSITGNIGYIFIILFLIIIFLIFSSNYKEKLKLYSEIDFRNYVIFLSIASAMLLTIIIEISFSVGLSAYGPEIKYGKGIIVFGVAFVFLLIGGIFTMIEYNKNSSEIILEKLKEKRERKEKENISLPF